MTRYYCLCDSTVIAQTNIPAKRCRKNLLGLFQPRVTDIAFSFFLSAEFSSCCLFLTICFLTLSVVGKTNISFSSGACHLSVTVTPPPPPNSSVFPQHHFYENSQSFFHFDRNVFPSNPYCFKSVPKSYRFCAIVIS